MRANRSMPQSTVIPVLAYPDLNSAVDWLCGAFGFSVRLRISTHRAQLNVGDGAIVVTGLPPGTDQAPADDAHRSHSVIVRVDDVDTLYARAVRHGASIVAAPATYPYGERQCTADDLAGQRWTFSQSVEDVAPEDWGGIMGEF